ncbi:MAG: hypothetical protein HUJ76_03305 [Parasporobacterium sp.]|nr:hypothetical protein [Parasporobacterium sp.]
MRLYTIITGPGKIPEVAVQGINGELYLIKDLGFDFRDMNQLIESASDSEMQKLKDMAGTDISEDTVSFSFEEVTVCSPIIEPGQDVICLGINYDEHKNETLDIEAT